MSILIHNVTIFTNNEQNAILHDQAVAIEGHRIKAVGPEAALKPQYTQVERIDGEGRLLMPGLVNTHMHFYGTYARGLSLPVTPTNFHE